MSNAGVSEVAQTSFQSIFIQVSPMSHRYLATPGGSMRSYLIWAAGWNTA